MTEWNRREFLRLLATLPPMALLGCESGGEKVSTKAAQLSPEESLKKLINILGPWGDNERERADNFANRFLNAEHLTGAYFPEKDEVVQSLAARFHDEMKAANEIDLGSLPASERELLVGLAAQLYSLTEVRFFVCGEPQAGQCLGDKTWHTKAPDRG